MELIYLIVKFINSPKIVVSLEGRAKGWGREGNERQGKGGVGGERRALLLNKYKAPFMKCWE